MRMAVTAIRALVGILLIANGTWMLITPSGWFAATPIVWRTGVPNAHFIRDVGWTYVTVGAIVVWGMADRRFQTLSLLIAIIWLVGHAAIHVGETATGICSPRQFANETPQVLGPLFLLALALGLDVVDNRRRAT